MITLTDVAYVRSGAADLDAATRFATEIVGLELATPLDNNGVAHLRADHRHHCLALVEGPSGVIASGFTVADSDALEAAETEIERSGLSHATPSPGIAFDVDAIRSSAIELRTKLRAGAREYAQRPGDPAGNWFFDPFVPDVVALRGREGEFSTPRTTTLWSSARRAPPRRSRRL